MVIKSGNLSKRTESEVARCEAIGGVAEGECGAVGEADDGGAKSDAKE